MSVSVAAQVLDNLEVVAERMLPVRPLTHVQPGETDRLPVGVSRPEQVPRAEPAVRQQPASSSGVKRLSRRGRQATYSSAVMSLTATSEAPVTVEESLVSRLVRVTSVAV